VTRFIAVALTALCQSAVSMPYPAAGDTGPGGGDRFGIRLVDAPVARRTDPRARTGIVDHLHPDTTIRRRFEVDNISRKTQTIQLYAAAAAITRHKFTILPGQTPNELTTWITLDKPALTIPPFGRKTARVTIQVPKNAAKGERYAVIWAADTAPPDAKHNIGAINRVGIPVYLDVGPGGEPPSDMAIERLTPQRAENGQPEVFAQVRNTGGRALTISGTLTLSGGPGGLRAGPYPANLGVTLLPGDTAPVSVMLDKRLPSGPWKAQLTLQSGMVRRTVSGTLTFPTSGIGRPIALMSATRDYAVPMVAGLAVAAGIPLLIRLRIRRRRR
jgi:hypothetical protein